MDTPCNPDPLKPGVKLMAGCNSAGVGVTSVSLPVVTGADPGGPRGPCPPPTKNCSPK